MSGKTYGYVHVSAKDFVRLLYLQMVSRLEPGDVLVVKSIDRYVAQTERDFIRQRQAEGIAAAKGFTRR